MGVVTSVSGKTEEERHLFLESGKLIPNLSTLVVGWVIFQSIKFRTAVSVIQFRIQTVKQIEIDPGPPKSKNRKINIESHSLEMR